MFIQDWNNVRRVSGDAGMGHWPSDRFSREMKHARNKLNLMCLFLAFGMVGLGGYFIHEQIGLLDRQIMYLQDRVDGLNVLVQSLLESELGDSHKMKIATGRI